MADSKNMTGLNSAFLAYLKKNGLRETFERKAIVESVAEYKGHFSLEELSDSIMLKGKRISRATLYNTISLLVKAGLVRRQQFADGRYHYDCTLALPSGNQLHLICTVCGKVTDLRNNSVIKELGNMKFGSFAPDYISLSVYGTCSRCARRQRREEASATNQLKLFK